jgi:hypothetical protein
MDILGLPPATRTYFLGCVATTALVHFDVVSPLYLYLNFNRCAEALFVPCASVFSSLRPMIYGDSYKPYHF